MVSAVVVLPLVFLVLQARSEGWETLRPLLFRSLTAQLIWDTVSLTVVVMVLCAVVGTLTAWFVERTDLPGRPIWAVLVVVPLGIPDFVVSFGWRAIFPSIGGFWAAVLVMTLAVYPLVFLPVAASLRNADPAQEEVARSLGLGRLRTFWRVTVGQARLAILGGMVLVGLVVLAEFGAFEILGYPHPHHGDLHRVHGRLRPGLGVRLLRDPRPPGCRDAGRGGRRARQGSGGPAGARRSPAPSAPSAGAGPADRLGRCHLPDPAGAGGTRRGDHLPAAARRRARRCRQRRSRAPPARPSPTRPPPAWLPLPPRLPVALLSVRAPGRGVTLIERSNMVILAVPGLIIALGFTYFTEHYLQGGSTRRPRSWC